MLLLAGALALAGCGGSSKSSASSSPATTSSSSATTSSSAAAPAPAAGSTLSLAANSEGLLKFDKTTLTVEKRGKKPESRVFTKDAELKTTGDLEQDARVTVYYREEGGQSVAHRVVVKSKGAEPSNSR